MAGKEKDYAKIAKSKITQPSKVKRKPKILVYARNKKGKTRFTMSAASNDISKLLILDPERGTDPFKQADPHVWPIEKWEDLQDAYGFLRSGKHEYEWVGMDGLTRFNNMALRYVMKIAEDRDLDRQPGMVDRRDYGKSGELMKQMLTNFHNLDMGVIYTAQERVESGGDDEDETQEASTFYVPDLPKGVRSYVNSVVDVIGRLYVSRVTVKGDKEVMQRRLWIGAHEKYDTGFRSDFSLPDMIKNPTVPKLQSLMLTGSDGTKEKK